MWGKFICWLVQEHDWLKDGAKRTCKRCGKHQWLFETPYPAIGEAKYQWQDMGTMELKP